MISGRLINIVKGADFSMLLQLQDSTGSLIDLTSFSGDATLRPTVGSVEEFTGFDFSIVSAVSGLVSLTMTSAVTNTLPVTQGVYDVDLYDVSGYASKIIWGYADVYPSTGPIDSNNGTVTIITNPISAGGGGSTVFEPTTSPTVNAFPVTASLVSLSVYGTATGFLGVPAGFVEIMVEGVPKKLPYY